MLDNLIQSLLVETQLQDQDENHTGLPESEAPTAEVSSKTLGVQLRLRSPGFGSAPGHPWGSDHCTVVELPQ